LFDDKNGNWWIILHAYENGHYNMGRQTLMQPVEWTSDGWFKTPDRIKTDKPIKKPALSATPSNFSLSDNFNGTTLGLQWKFYGEYDAKRFQLLGNGLIVNGKGSSVGDCSPLLCIPSNHSYEAQVEMFIEGDAIGGLALFYNPNFNSGILADQENILANLRGWQFTTEKKVIQNHVFLRLKNINSTVDMYYSTDGTNWTKTENSLEVSGLHHNVLSGFMSLRIGLCAIGNGTVTFKNFVYKAIQ
jgi:beta-xylosidase